MYYSRQTTSVCLILLSCIFSSSFSQSFELVFFNCDTSARQLCINDPGVELPDNNQIYLGENDPDATSCSVHLTQNIQVLSECSEVVNYFVELIINDTTLHVLQPLTTVADLDSNMVYELFFNSANAPDPIIREFGIPYNSGCNDYYRIRWTALDECGKVAVCENSVNLYDCKRPEYSFSESIFTADAYESGLVLLSADTLVKDFRDDCSDPEDFLISLRPDRYVPDSLMHMCDLAAWGVELNWPVWIADKGLDKNCDGTVEWSERQITPDSFLIVFVSTGTIDCGMDYYYVGEVATDDSRTVKDTKISLKIPGQPVQEQLTGEDGRFSYAFYLPATTVITAERDDNHKNGVSTLDLIKIQKHLLGSEKLTNPYKIIAADANNNQSVSVTDIVELRKLILGLYTTLPNNSSWRFVPENHVFPDILEPWPFPETITDQNISSSYLDFVAIKIGDVNNTSISDYSGIESRTGFPLIKWTAPEKSYLENEILIIELYPEQETVLNGFQFTVSSEDLEFEGVASGTIYLKDENFAIFGDKITFSWFSDEAVIVDPAKALFALHAKARSNGTLSRSIQINSDITAAEAYTSQEEIMIPELIFSSPEPFYPSVSLIPNPWNAEAILSFRSGKHTTAILEFYDLNGRSLLKNKHACQPGVNTIILNAEDFTTRGLLFYKLSFDYEVCTGKMIVHD